MTEEEKKQPEGLSRRQFLKDAGLVVGGATVGSMAILSACNGDAVTKTETKTVTTTVSGSGSTVTTTVTSSKQVCPIDGKEFANMDEFKAHFAAVHPGASLEGLVNLKVNGVGHWMYVKPEWTLAFVLREKLKLFGTKLGCDRAQCGTCTVIANGKTIYACAVLAIEAEDLEITTIEGLAKGGKLTTVQQNFLDDQVFQCGYCTPGMIMTATALLNKTPKPTVEQVREALSGNICFCGDSTRQVNVVMRGV